MTASEQVFPKFVDIKFFDKGFIARVDAVSVYYENMEALSKALFPCIRGELTSTDACAGSC